MKSLGYKIYRKGCYFFRKIQIKVAKNENALNQDIREEKIIVSLTSYPARFPYIHLALKSIMLQTVKPDKIIVWLDENVTRGQLTKEMMDLEQYGIEYRNMPGDLKPHKKYIHAMQEYPEDIIVTVDDDLIYASDLIESLLETHEKYPNAVCARRVHKITRDKNGKISPYNNWQGEYMGSLIPSNELIATGVGGVLYPPHCLYREAFDAELIEKLSLKADDIWLKFMELLAGTKVVWAACKIPIPEAIEKKQSSNLRSENVNQNMNDVYFNKIINYFNINTELFWK